MRVAKHFVIFAAIAVAGAMATPAMANDSVLTHPGEICIQEVVENDFSDDLIGMLFAGAGLGEMPESFDQDLGVAVTECIATHGMSDSAVERSRDVGRYSAARATRNESLRRLQSRGVDLAWLDSAYATAVTGEAANPQAITMGILAQMTSAAPEGLGIDALDGSEAGRFIAALTFGYVYSQLEVDRLGAEL